jgi:hypothetical protein
MTGLVSNTLHKSTNSSKFEERFDQIDYKEQVFDCSSTIIKGQATDLSKII